MCDAYSVTRLERHDYSDKNLTCTYYIKFAISKTGHLLLVASIHPEGA